MTPTPTAPTVKAPTAKAPTAPELAAAAAERAD